MATNQKPAPAPRPRDPKPAEVWQMSRAELEHRYIRLLNTRDVAYLVAFMVGGLVGGVLTLVLLSWLSGGVA